MKAIIRKDEEAVSPVIATILMVAITVVLAAVLYVMVSGLITSPGSTPKAIGVVESRSNNGANYVLTLSSVPSGLSLNGTVITLITASGLATNVTAVGLGTQICFGAGAGCTALANFHGVRYYATSTTAVSAGDRVLISASATAGYFPTGTQYQFSSGSTILATGTLQ